MQKTTLNILLVESKGGDAEIFARGLEQARAAGQIPFDFNITRAASLDQALARCSSQPFNFLALDLALPDPLTALNKIMETAALARLAESEERSRLVAEMASDYVYKLKVNPDQTTSLEWITDGFARITGYGAEDMKSLDGFRQNALHSDDATAYRRMLESAAGGESGEAEVRVKAKSGQTLWLRLYMKPLTDETGKVTGILGAGRDVTADKRMRGEQERERDFLAAMMERSEAMIVSVDREGRVVYFNRAAERSLQYAAHEVLGRPFWEVAVSAENRAQARDIFLASIKKNRVMPARVAQWQARDGGSRMLKFSNTAHYDAEGKIDQMMALALDVTDEKVALTEARRRAEETAALLAGSRAVSSASDFHEAARMIFEACRGLTGAGSGYVALVDPEGKIEIAHMETGEAECATPTSEDMHLRGLREVAASKKRVAIENDFMNCPHAGLLPHGHSPVENVLFAPMMMDGKVSGLLGLANKNGGFDQDDARMAAAFAEMAGVALKNARTLEVLEASEEQFRSVVQTAMDGILIVDESGRVCFMNSAAEDIFSRAVVDTVGQPVTNLLPACLAGDRPDFSDFLETATESLARDPDGTAFPVEISVSRWRGDEKSWHTLIVRDISERKAAEEELRRYRDHLEELVQFRTRDLKLANIELKEEIAERVNAEKELLAANELLESVFSTTHLLIAYLDRDFNFIRVNRAYADSVKMPLDYFPGKNHFDLYPHEENENIFRQVVETGHSYVAREKAFAYKDLPELGVTYWDWSLHPVKDQKHRVEGLVLSLVDVTEKVRARQAEKEAVRQLEDQRARSIFADRLRSLGQMAAGMSHELNQPLVGVRGLAEHIKLSLDRGWNIDYNDLKHKVNLIVEQADRMSHVIEHARMFARGADSPRAELLDINEVVDSGLGLLGSQLRSRGIELVRELTPGLPMIEANRFSLEEVLLNLVANARDATMAKLAKEPPGKMSSVIIRTSPLHSAAGVNIEVADSADGIPPEIIDKIWDPFFTTKDPDKGTGLGLAISRNIVQKYGGSIRVESAPGKGTTVSVSLPAAKRSLK